MLIRVNIIYTCQTLLLNHYPNITQTLDELSRTCTSDLSYMLPVYLQVTVPGNARSRPFRGASLCIANISEMHNIKHKKNVIFVVCSCWFSYTSRITEFNPDSVPRTKLTRYTKTTLTTANFRIKSR